MRKQASYVAEDGESAIRKFMAEGFWIETVDHDGEVKRYRVSAHILTVETGKPTMH